MANKKYCKEVLQIELGFILNQKRELEKAYISKTVKKDDYDQLKASYESHYNECNELINRLGEDPDIYLASDPKMISNISFMGQSVTFSYDELEMFMHFKFIEQKDIKTAIVVRALERINTIAQERGIEEVRSCFPKNLVEFDEKRGYILLLDNVI